MNAPDELEELEGPTITAGELRALGHAIPERIPDCGWIPAGSMRVVVSGPGEVNDRREVTGVTLALVFDAPFRWVEVNGTIDL